MERLLPNSVTNKIAHSVPHKKWCCNENGGVNALMYADDMIPISQNQNDILNKYWMKSDVC